MKKNIIVSLLAIAFVFAPAAAAQIEQAKPGFAVEECGGRIFLPAWLTALPKKPGVESRRENVV